MSRRRFSVRCLIVVFLLAVSAPAASAIGFYSGANYAAIDATLEYEGLDIDLNAGRGAGWQIGAFADWDLNPQFGLRVGLSWNRYNSSADYVESGSEDLGAFGVYDWVAHLEGDNEATVIAMPVDFIARPILSHSDWFVSVGGAVVSPGDAQLTGEGELVISQEGTRLETITESYDVDYDRYMKDYVALMGVGVGRDFRLFGAQSFAWLRYERSVSDWADKEGYEVGASGFILLVGVKL